MTLQIFSHSQCWARPCPPHSGRERCITLQGLSHASSTPIALSKALNSALQGLTDKVRAAMRMAAKQAERLLNSP